MTRKGNGKIFWSPNTQRHLVMGKAGSNKLLHGMSDPGTWYAFGRIRGLITKVKELYPRLFSISLNQGMKVGEDSGTVMGGIGT